jgi:hypothetical protein
LFTSLDVPGLGGSSTAAFDLFCRLLADGVDAHFLNLVDVGRAAFLETAYGPSMGNPSGLPNVHTHRFPRALWDPQPELARWIDQLDPAIIIGVGWIAARIALRATPQRNTVLLTGSCRSAQDYVTTGRVADVQTLIGRLEANSLPSLRVHQGELEVYRNCRLVLTHSSQTLLLVQRFFSHYVGKIYPEVFWFAEWICAGAETAQARILPFEQRDIDVLFVATNWKRPEKNYPMVKRIARSIRGAAVHLVGEAVRPPGSVVHHGLVADRGTLFGLMGRARCIVCPSLMDAAPGVLFEGSVLGCNLVASRNCGNWELCHPELLAEPFGLERLVECTRKAIARKYPDRLDRFLTPSSYQGLIRTLAALAEPWEPGGPA